MLIKVKDSRLLHELLIRNGYSKNSFANKINISASYVFNVVNGKQSPSPKLAKLIVENLNVSFDDIFFIEDASKKERSLEGVEK